MNAARRSLLVACLAFAGFSLTLAPAAHAASASKLTASGRAKLQELVSASSKAARYNSTAKAVLVFPKIVKAGLMIGGQSGDGVLLQKGSPIAYFNLSAASFGMQAGGQSFSYALFFMNDKSLSYLKTSNGWAIGSGPSVVVIDKGKAMSNTSTTVTQDVYAFPFGAKGLMGGLGLEGSKISPIHPKE
jgi:lipid-binding SYLF domain-containing protein